MKIGPEKAKTRVEPGFLVQEKLSRANYGGTPMQLVTALVAAPLIGVITVHSATTRR